MGNSKRLRKRFRAFVNGLTEDQVREQLVLAYLQMEKCRNVLKGRNPEPVAMMDNGDSSDLELFYQCKKVAEELAYLNDIASKPEEEGIDFSMKLDASKFQLDTKAIQDSIRELSLSRLRDFVCPKNRERDESCRIKMRFFKDRNAIEFSGFDGLSAFALDVDLIEKFIERESGRKKEKRIDVGKTPVYLLVGGRLHKTVVDHVIGLGPMVNLRGYDGPFNLMNVSMSPEEVLDKSIKTILGHKSLSKETEPAFFIDKANRIFKGAEWYLEEKGIQHFASIGELRKYLLEHIIDDTK